MAGMETIWIAIQHPDRHVEWQLVTKNAQGEVVARHAQVNKVNGKWVWVTQPPNLQRGTAGSHDDARLAAEKALLEPQQGQERSTAEVTGNVLFSPWKGLEKTGALSN